MPSWALGPWVPTLLSNLVTESGVPKLPHQLQVWSFPRMAHRIQENTLLSTSGLLQRVQMKSHVKRYTGCGPEGSWAQELLSLWRWGEPPSQNRDVCPHGSSSWSRFLWRFHYCICDWVNHWPSVINSISSTSPSLILRSESSNPQITGLVPMATNPTKDVT